MFNQDGYSLIELLIVVSISVSLLWFAMPFDQSLYQKNQLKILMDTVNQALAYGRTRALAEDRFLVLKPIDDTNWSSGFVLFIDNKTHQFTKENSLQYWSFKPGLFEIQWHGFRSNHAIVFSPTLKQAACNGHFSFLIHGKEVAKLVVNRVCYTHGVQL